MVFAFIALFAAHTLFDVFGVQRKNLKEVNQRQSAEAAGTITLVEKKSRGNGIPDSVFTYTYVVNGVSYSESRTLGAYSKSSDSYKGLEVKVCYNPLDPHDSNFYIQEESYQKICGK